MKTGNAILFLPFLVAGLLVLAASATAAEIIAINTSWSDTPENMRLFEERYDSNYSLGFDFGERITDHYEVTAVPTEFIVDINGVIRYRNSVPKYVVAHLPDWLSRSGPSRGAAQPVHAK